MNKNFSEFRTDPREKLLKILELLKEHTTSNNLKIPKNFNYLIRKLYKYIKPKINLMNVNFNDLEDIDKEKQ